MRRGRPRHPDILTPRQWQVLELLRQGLTNEEIARRLGLTADGAKYHVSEILSKLGVSTRQEAVAWLSNGAKRPWWQLRLAPPRAVSLAKFAAAGLLIAVMAGFAVFAAAVLTSDDGRSADVAVVSTFAGASEQGPNQGGHRDGPLAKALFSYPRSTAIEPAGNINVTSDQNILLRKISASGEVSTLTGPESRGEQSGLFENITVVTRDPDGNVYLGGGRILYKVRPDGSVSVAACSYRPDSDLDGKAIPYCSTEVRETGPLTGPAAEVQLSLNVRDLAAVGECLARGDFSTSCIHNTNLLERLAGRDK